MSSVISGLLRYIWMLLPAVGVYVIVAHLFGVEALAVILAGVAAIYSIVREDHASRARKDKGGGG